MATVASGQTEDRSHLKRQQKVTFHVDDTLSNDSDPLPIVELKPFVHKVWRREKSLPSFYDRTSLPPRSVPDTSKSKEPAPITSVAPPQVPTLPDATSTVQRSTSISSQVNYLPSPRLVQMYVSAFSDYKSQKEHISSLVGESSFRPKSRLHPPIDTKTSKQPEHTESLIPGFITREDRAKSTQMEINDGDSVNRAYSCSPKAVTPDEIRKQQEMKIKGERLRQTNNRKQLQYLIPLKPVCAPNGWHTPGIRHGSPASLLFNSSKSRVKQGYKRANTPLYDHLDREGTLPSLAITSENIRKRSTSRYDDGQSDDYNDYRDAFDDTKQMHNIGGIKNAFKVLSKHGSPTKVERQLSFELEVNLSRFRKSRDYCPFEISPSDMAKYYPQPNFNMTQGEQQLRKGLKSNASKRHSRTRSRGTTITNPRSEMSYVSDHALSPGMYKHRVDGPDNLDSYLHESLFYSAYHNSPRMTAGKASQTDDVLRSATVNTMHTMETTTTGDEYQVDTPRSPSVSRVSGKLSAKPTQGQDTTDDYSVCRTGQTQQSPDKGAVPIEVQQSSPSTSNSTSVSMDARGQLEGGEVTQTVVSMIGPMQLHTGLPGGGLIREKTFLTNSDTLEPVPVTG